MPGENKAGGFGTDDWGRRVSKGINTPRDGICVVRRDQTRYDCHTERDGSVFPEDRTDLIGKLHVFGIDVCQFGG